MTEEKHLTLCFAGDTMVGRKASVALESEMPRDILGELAPIMNACDGVITNLECPITRCKQPGRRTWKTFRMRAGLHAVDFLTSANVKFVNLANNHILDFGEAGLEETLQILDANGIAHAGAGMTEAAARSPATVTIDGVSIGVISLSDRMEFFAAGDSRPGTNYFRVAGESRELVRLIEDWVGYLRSVQVELIILSIHIGPDFEPVPSRAYRKLARTVIDLGVDIIHGHSAHLFQGVEIYKGRPILYDTGNFYDDYLLFPFFPTNESFLYMITTNSRSIETVEFIPIVRLGHRLHLARAKTFERITRRMVRKSRRFGTHMKIRSDRLVVTLD
jgi:poly-gamma-glutamate synthesis protein (capsule biosynthesis protein)